MVIMAFRPHTHCSFGGRLVSVGEPDEEWNCNINVADGNGDPLATPDTYMQAISGPLATWFGNVNNYIWNGAKLDYLKVNNVGANGNQIDPTNTNTHAYSNVQGGNGDASAMPFIMCFSYGWRSAKARGPGSHGRIYLPNNVIARQQNGGMKMTATAVQPVLDSALALVSIFDSTVPGGGVHVVIASKVNATNTPINRVVVGDVADVQRRRKNRLSEVYATSAVF
jgi:hypothetical protein